MTQLAELQTTIPVPSSDVYAYVSNMENYKDWFPGVADIRAEDDLPVATIGKRYREKLNMPTGPAELVIEVTQAIVGERFVTEGDLPGLLPRMTITTESAGAQSCRITLTYESRHPDMADNRALVAALHRDLTTRGDAGLETLEKILVARTS